MPLSESPNSISVIYVISFVQWLNANTDRINGHLSTTPASSPLYAGVTVLGDDWNALLAGGMLHLWNKKGSDLKYDTRTGDLDCKDLDLDVFNEVVEAFKTRFTGIA